MGRGLGFDCGDVVTKLGLVAKISPQIKDDKIQNESFNALKVRNIL